MSSERSRVLVTGSYGRLGLQVCRFLRSVDFVDLIPMASRAQGGVDITAIRDLRDFVSSSKPDVVMHLAGMVGADCDRDPETAELVNVRSTFELAQASQEAGCSSFVFASSASVYGDQMIEPVDEESSTAPASGYAHSKLSAEQALSDFETSNLKVVSLRIFNIYGVGFDKSLVNRLETSSPSNKTKLVGWSNFVRDYVKSTDVASAFLRASQYKGTASKFNIASGEAISNEELVRRLQLRQQVEFEVTDNITSYSVANVSLAERELDFHAELFS